MPASEESSHQEGFQPGRLIKPRSQKTPIGWRTVDDVITGKPSYTWNRTKQYFIQSRVFYEFYENVSLLVAALILSSWSTFSRLESFATSPLSQQDNLCKVSSLTNCQHFQVVIKILFFLFFLHIWSSSNCQHYQSCQVVVKILF